ncbi:hypothetical protein HPB51_012562 [Rhipicephalus microplus]|uniref:Uncharacterized protein n=1 Tax=Rhipicephalus microplus TaxID=6941 RepID=A0A9J6DGE6_RHIMP|nr:hypothetical protein HPB51_012562 [Rhipicephalus microplus]
MEREARAFRQVDPQTSSANLADIISLQLFNLISSARLVHRAAAGSSMSGGDVTQQLEPGVFTEHEGDPMVSISAPSTSHKGGVEPKNVCNLGANGRKLINGHCCCCGFRCFRSAATSAAKPGNVVHGNNGGTGRYEKPSKRPKVPAGGGWQQESPLRVSTVRQNKRSRKNRSTKTQREAICYAKLGATCSEPGCCGDIHTQPRHNMPPLHPGGKKHRAHRALLPSIERTGLRHFIICGRYATGTTSEIAAMALGFRESQEQPQWEAVEAMKRRLKHWWCANYL